MKPRQGLSLSHFKKIHEDDHSATLQHPNGHKVVIAKNALNPKLKNDLAQLPMHFYDGGDTQASSQPDPNAEPDLNSMSDNRSPASDQNSQQAPQDPSLANSFGQSVGRNLKTLYDLSTAGPKYAGSVAKDFVRGVGGNEQDSTSDTGRNPSASQVNTPAPLPPATQNTGFQLPSNNSEVAGLNTGYGQQLAAAREQQEASKAEGQARDLADQKYIESVNAVNQNMQSLKSKHDAESAAVIKDWNNGYINPNHFMENQSTPAKVSTAIGLILGGIGGGLLHQENPALKFLNSQIDRDIESQKATAGNKLTMLGVMRQKYNSDVDALAATRTAGLDIYGAELKKAADSTTDPRAKAIADQAQGIINVEKAKTMAPVLQNQAIYQGIKEGKVDPIQGIQWKIPPGHDQDEAQKEISKAMEVEKLRGDLQSSFNDLNSRFLGGALSPAARQSAMNTFAGPLGHMATGRYNQEEAQNQANALLKGILESKDTTQVKQQRLNQFFDSFRNEPVLIKYAGSGYNIVPKGYGSRNAPTPNPNAMKPR